MLSRRSAAVGVTLLAWSGLASAQPNFDGLYRSPSGPVAGNAACGTTKFGYPLRVSNGVATLQTVSQGQLEGPVGPDGSVSFGRGTAQVTGRISGNQFAGTLAVGRCQFSLQYSKG